MYTYTIPSRLSRCTYAAAIAILYTAYIYELSLFTHVCGTYRILHELHTLRARIRKAEINIICLFVCYIKDFLL